MPRRQAKDLLFLKVASENEMINNTFLNNPKGCAGKVCE
jgi:hypothetical protein